VKPGEVAVTSRTTGRVVKEVTTSTANFFPGLFLLEERSKAREEQRRQEEPE